MDAQSNIALLLPTNRGLKPKTLQSLLEMVAHTTVKTVLISTEGFTTAENRIWLAAQAIKKGATHLLFVDDDMVYEKDMLEKLLEHDVDIVGAKYANRRGTGEVIEYLDEPEGNFFKVKALGGGCLLVKKVVFERTPQPWFGYKTLPTGAVSMSNDWFFCEKAHESGFEIWCDTRIKPGHIAIKEF